MNSVAVMQQMLAIGRALVANPDLVLMDEPSEGLSPRFVLHVGEIMKRMRSLGHAILLVEQNLALALSVAESCAHHCFRPFCFLRNA